MFLREVIGHQELKQKLINDVKNNQVPHAMMLSGEMGFGGTALTLAFIQFLMCENRQEEDSCGECNNCRSIQKLEHPDIHFTFPTVQAISQTSDPQFLDWKELILDNPYIDLNDWITHSDERGRKPIISVHQSMDIMRKLQLKAFKGGYKVSVIWYAEEMNQMCANKLLKIIEEPPNNTVFILLVSSTSGILPTILSRTQISKIKPLKEEDILEYFTKKGNYTAELIKSAASASEGNIARANEILQNKGSQENQYFSQFVELMRICYKKQVMPMIAWAESISSLSREEQKQFLKYALHMIRLSMLNNYQTDSTIPSSEEEQNFLTNFSRFITGNNVMDFHKLFSESHYNVERNAHSQLLFTNITFEVMRYIHRA